MTEMKKMDTMIAKKNLIYESRRTMIYDDVDNDKCGGHHHHQYTPNIEWKDTKGKDHHILANPQLASHSHVFQNLLKTDTVVTDYVITSMVMTYDSTKIISV